MKQLNSLSRKKNKKRINLLSHVSTQMGINVATPAARAFATLALRTDEKKGMFSVALETGEHNFNIYSNPPLSLVCRTVQIIGQAASALHGASNGRHVADVVSQTARGGKSIRLKGARESRILKQCRGVEILPVVLYSRGQMLCPG